MSHFNNASTAVCNELIVPSYMKPLELLSTKNGVLPAFLFAIIRNLKALIYFTDGDGIYPEQKPDYETAFVFVRQTEKMNLVPRWAKKLLTEECTL